MAELSEDAQRALDHFREAGEEHRPIPMGVIDSKSLAGLWQTLDKLEDAGLINKEPAGDGRWLCRIK